MKLYGVYGEHTLDNCPLFNKDSRKTILNLDINPKELKFISMYHSPLEHTFLWVVEAEDPHLIQHCLIKREITRYNNIKIVLLSIFEALVNRCKSLEKP